MSRPGAGEGTREGKEQEKPRVIKTTTDLQRLKLEKLMKNPDKPVLIPESPRSKSLPSAPDFVRNVMGSSAGAGSGEFHVYRHLRRKEYARQKFIQEKSEKEKLDDDYHSRIERNKKLAEEKTARKRAKRLKKKKNAKLKAKKAKTDRNSDGKTSESESDSDGENKDSCGEERNTEKTENDDIQSRNEEDSGKKDPKDVPEET